MHYDGCMANQPIIGSTLKLLKPNRFFTLPTSAFRHTATYNAYSCSVDPTFPGAMPQVSSALERKAR
ncbi:hypothetical protein [Desulfosporosinus meridiei]|uniref:hypothetical protein n=1 Tax=Desulfosporosinus meridiei TaxID=79209 RepID=UPI0011D1D962|nr:hypothetical protein [Desulfosporosinus meridiei]